jgi:hypothetical protein
MGFSFLDAFIATGNPMVTQKKKKTVAVAFVDDRPLPRATAGLSLKHLLLSDFARTDHLIPSRKIARKGRKIDAYEGPQSKEQSK